MSVINITNFTFKFRNREINRRLFLFFKSTFKIKYIYITIFINSNLRQ